MFWCASIVMVRARESGAATWEGGGSGWAKEGGVFGAAWLISTPKNET